MADQQLRCHHFVPEVPAGSDLASAAGLALLPEVSAAASVSAAGAADAAGALADAGVDAAAELVAEPGEGLLGVATAAPKTSESSSLNGSAWSSTDVSDGDMLIADGLIRGDLSHTMTWVQLVSFSGL